MLAAIIDPTPGYFKGVTGETPVTAKKAAGALPEIGNNNDIGLVIARAGFNPCFPLAHVVRCTQVCVPVTAPDLQAAKLVYKKEVLHATCGIKVVRSVA